MSVYKDKQGREIFISQGIGEVWASYFRKQSGALKRIKSKYLPLRNTDDEAQKDLDAYAKKHNLTKID